jgi:hypothetical protein
MVLLYMICRDSRCAATLAMFSDMLQDKTVQNGHTQTVTDAMPNINLPRTQVTTFDLAIVPDGRGSLHRASCHPRANPGLYDPAAAHQGHQERQQDAGRKILCIKKVANNP